VRAPAQDLGLLPPSERQDQGGGSPPERDAQFRYISGQVKRCLKRGWPALAVDTKQKERMGTFKHAGRTGRKVGQPDEVHMQAFPHLGEGITIPPGAYDIQRNQGLVTVGMTHETAEFAVERIRRWWRHDPRPGPLPLRRSRSAWAALVSRPHSRSSPTILAWLAP
jgi:hypothetical protein